MESVRKETIDADGRADRGMDGRDVGSIAAQAGEASSRRDWPEALRLWTDVLNLSPDFQPAYFGAAEVACQLRDFARAEAILLQGAERFPEELRYILEYALIAHGQGHWPAAADRYAMGRRAFPGVVPFYAREASCRREAGQWDEAERLLADALGTFPNDHSLWIEWAQISNRRQDWPEAVRRWDAMRTRFPDLSAAYVGVVLALTSAGRGSEGVALLEQAAERFPNDRAVIIEYAKSAHGRGDWSEAHRRWIMFRERFPMDVAGYVHGAEALEKTGDSAAAQALLTEAIGKFPDDAGMAVNRFNSLAAANDTAQLLSYWEGAAPRFRENPFVINAAVRALARHGRVAQANELLQDAIGRLPGHTLLWLTWADIASGSGELRLAADRLRRGAEAFPGDAEFEVRFAETALSLREFGPATEALDRAAILAPQNERVARLRLNVAMQEGDHVRIGVAWAAAAAHPSIHLRDKLHFAWDIIRRLPGGPTWNDAMIFLLCEPDPGDREWLPKLDTVDAAMGEPERARIVAIARDFLAGADTSDCTPICVEVLRSFIGDPVPNDQAVVHFRTTLVAGRLRLISALFRMRIYDKEPARLVELQKAFRGWAAPRLAEMQFQDVTEYREAFFYLLFASVHDPNFHGAMAVELERRIEPKLVPFPEVSADYRQALGDIAARTRQARFSAGAAPAHRRLKIALCVSGQLRGYEATFPSWKSLNLAEHDTTLFIHTWKRVGLQWGRALQFVHHDPMLRELASPQGKAIIRARYHHLSAVLTEALGRGDEVTEAELSAFYGTEHVIVEDDSLPEFKTKANQWKMHYKIEQAYRMATAHSSEYDLVLRLRPDLEVEVRTPLDFRELAALSASRRFLIAEFRNMFLTKYWMGDKFVLGAQEPMEVFSTAFSTMQTLEAHRAAIDIPPDFEGHLSLATACSLRGIPVSTLPALHAQKMLNPPVIPPALLHEALSLDLEAAPSGGDEFDRHLLEACRAAAERG